MGDFGIISADSHVLEPPDLWGEYIEPRYRERAPHMLREGDADLFVIEGVDPMPIGNQSAAGVAPEEMRQNSSFEEVFRGGWNPEARVRDMDTDRIDVEVLYPSFCMGLWKAPDVEYQLACMRAYNDWMADFVAGRTERLVGLGLIPLDDIDAAVRELQRAAGKGLKGACISAVPPEDRPYSDPVYDPFWAAAQEARLPLSLHVFTGKRAEMGSDFLTGYALLPHWIQGTVGSMISNGVLERFPELRMISAELDIGWIASFLRRLDHAYVTHRHWSGAGASLTMLPSEYFHRQVYATFMDDQPGIQTRYQAGLENLMWSSDYPHPDSTWPHSVEVIERLFKDLPEAEKRMLVHDNAAGLYGLS